MSLEQKRWNEKGWVCFGTTCDLAVMITKSVTFNPGCEISLHACILRTWFHLIFNRFNRLDFKLNFITIFKAQYSIQKQAGLKWKITWTLFWQCPRINVKFYWKIRKKETCSERYRIYLPFLDKMQRFKRVNQAYRTDAPRVYFDNTKFTCLVNKRLN